LQFAEGLCDRQAADAVRARIDWKHALGQELNDPRFDYSILSEFHDRLLKGSAQERLLDKMLGEALRAALNTLAGSVPQWLREQVSAQWFQRYGQRIEQYRLPKSEPERNA
jgi:transposase